MTIKQWLKRALGFDKVSCNNCEWYLQHAYYPCFDKCLVSALDAEYNPGCGGDYVYCFLCNPKGNCLRYQPKIQPEEEV